MAELIDEADGDCCAPARRASCCAPDRQAGCCDDEGGCGCEPGEPRPDLRRVPDGAAA